MGRRGTRDVVELMQSIAETGTRWENACRAGTRAPAARLEERVRDGSGEMMPPTADHMGELLGEDRLRAPAHAGAPRVPIARFEAGG